MTTGYYSVLILNLSTETSALFTEKEHKKLVALMENFREVYAQCNLEEIVSTNNGFTLYSNKERNDLKVILVIHEELLALPFATIYESLKDIINKDIVNYTISIVEATKGPDYDENTVKLLEILKTYKETKK